MYKIIRYFFFLLSPEVAHNFTCKMLKIFRCIPFSGCITRLLFQYKNPALEREVMGIKFPNPIGIAGGFDKNAEVYNDMANFGFGFMEIGSVTPKPQPGNQEPRLFRLPQDKAIINRMGINNKGVKAIANNLKENKPKIIIGGNISKNSTTPAEQAPLDYEKSFALLYNYVDFFVLNVSCPNVKNLAKLQEVETLSSIIDKLTQSRQYFDEYRPILLKVSPDLSLEMLNDIIELVQISGLDGIVVSNTTLDRSNLTTSQEVLNGIGHGGLSGAPLKEKALSMVRYISKKTEGVLPIIGVGGIFTPQDAKDMLNAGASLVEVFTGFVYEGPSLPRRILKSLSKDLKEKPSNK